MRNVMAGIITYNPDLEALKRAVESIRGQVEQIVIVDNGSNNLTEMKKCLQCADNLKVIRNQKNRGMAGALNQLFAYASKTGCRWVLTLDQDTVCCRGLVSHMERFAQENTAVVGPNVIYKNNEAFCHTSSEKAARVPWVITSGSLTNVDVWSRIGGFDEMLFIDGVDKDFCLRAGMENYMVCRDDGVWIWHGLGNLKCRKAAGRTIYVTNHEPRRVYSMARNAVYLDAKLGIQDAWLDLFKMAVKILLFEKRKAYKISAVMHGIIDGMAMSKTSR